jgi:formamidopyrimidine-DNA glycosylase
VISKPTLQQHLIEDVLVDQKVLMSGIGNYLKAEILYDTRISPLRLIKDITFDEWIHIFKSAKKLTKEMLAILKSKDKSSEKYMSAMKVYSRKQDPYGNPVHTRTTKTGRTTWWVPAIQK